MSKPRAVLRLFPIPKLSTKPDDKKVVRATPATQSSQPEPLSPEQLNLLHNGDLHPSLWNPALPSNPQATTDQNVQKAVAAAAAGQLPSPK